MTTSECRAKIWPEKIIYAPTAAFIAVHSKGVVLLLLIHCILLLLFGGFLCLNLVLLCSSLCPFKFCNHLVEEVRAGCFT